MAVEVCTDAALRSMRARTSAIRSSSLEIIVGVADGSAAVAFATARSANR